MLRSPPHWARLGAEREISPDSECLVWMPRDLVFRLLALREPEKTFSDVILRLVERGSFAALTGSAVAGVHLRSRIARS